MDDPLRPGAVGIEAIDLDVYEVEGRDDHELEGGTLVGGGMDVRLQADGAACGGRCEGEGDSLGEVFLLNMVRMVLLVALRGGGLRS